MIDIIAKNIELEKVEDIVMDTVKTSLSVLEFDDEVEVSISFVDEVEIQSLNRDYRNKDSVTDVLSFTQYTDEGFEAFEDEPVYIGDIVICTERANEQAEEFGHSFEREVSYLVCHGVLHLMGYDHIEDEDKAEMRAMEKVIMDMLSMYKDPSKSKSVISDPSISKTVNSEKLMKTGFVSIVGRPNVGKSTLINAILNEKVFISTDKPQTTRNNARAIYTTDDVQMIFVDTPGIHKPKHKLGEYMVKSINSSLDDVDLILYVVDDFERIGKVDDYLLDVVNNARKNVVIVVNKTDKIPVEKFKKYYEHFMSMDFVDDVLGVSASEGRGVKELRDYIASKLPTGPMYYPEDMIVDKTERELVAEMIREKVLLYMSDEIPHGVNVSVESFVPRKDKNIIDISAVIVCEKKSHKGMIIGKSGRKLKGIGKSAREDIERFLGAKVFLKLWVKVKENWRNDVAEVKRQGYDINNI